MDKKILLSTTDSIPGMPAHMQHIDVISRTCRLYSVDQFEGVNDMLRETAKDKEGDAVIGIDYHFVENGITATGTVVKFDHD